MAEQKYEKNVRPYDSTLDENASIYQNKEPKSEKQKWKELKGKEKLQYFLEYYGFLTAGVIFGIVVVLFFVVHFATKQDVVLGILAVNTDGEAIEATGADYFQDFLEENGVDTNKNTMSVNYTMYIDSSSPDAADSSTLDSIQTLFMAQSVDLFFADKNFFETMAGDDYMTDLQDYLPQELLNQYADEIIYAKNSETGEKIVAGILLENNTWLKKTGWYQGTAVVGIANNVKNKKLAKQMMLAILEQ